MVRTGAWIGIPDGYRIERRERDDPGSRIAVRFDVFERDGRLVDTVKVRQWAGTWHVQRSPTAGVPVTPDEAAASAYAFVQAIEAARRGNDGGAP